nr:hypothetical protein [Tanacetum cinerariifolium]
MMSQTTLPKSFWDYALETAARILNMVPTKKIENTPYEVWHGQTPKLSYLKLWGCEALVKRDTLTKPDKLERRSIKCIFIGCPKVTMGYSFYYPPKNKVLVAQNVEFLKNSFITQEASGSLEDLKIIQKEDTHPSIDTSLNHKEDDLEIDEPQSDIILICRNEVWDLVDLPPNGKTIGSKWLFKKKIDMDEAVHTYKARLVANGYTQTLRIDYEETFSPIADIRAIRILIAIAAFSDHEIWQMDVKTAFLNGYLSEEVYMEQPEGASTPAGLLAVGFIMYAVRCTRTNVAFAQNMTSRIQQNPGDLHWLTVKNILKYLKNTKDMFLIYKGTVDCKSAKQGIFATSSAEVEYIAAYDASKEAVWVKNFIYGLGVVPTIKEPISMYCDKTGAITIANKSRIAKGARHFCAKVHYLREVIEYGVVKLKKVHTDDNLADPFTKALAFPKHSEHTKNIGMLSASSLM